MEREQEKAYERLSPFEIKDKLVSLAAEHARRSTQVLLDAGRGNPNWLAATPREAFFALGLFAMQESRRAGMGPHLSGMPAVAGIAGRLYALLTVHAGLPGMSFLAEAVNWGVDRLGFEADAFVHELVEGVLGCHYPSPVHMLSYVERLVHAYLIATLCGGRAPAGRYDLFATEGGTAAMCYVFDALVTNGLLRHGDTIALGVPIFTPYLEIPRLTEYGFHVIELTADENEGWQYPDAELDKLTDPAVKALVVVNPGNPTSVAIQERSVRRIAAIVREVRPDLIIVSDDVYATFVDGFHSLLAAVPANTIGVYSFSKYFGVTGWRLGVIALHEANAFDAQLARLPQPERTARAARYAAIAVAPEQLKLIDRMVADSRRVALNHTAGLSTPQQVQMALLAAAGLLDRDDAYRRAAQATVRRRHTALWRGLGDVHQHDVHYAAYYETIDLERWMRQRFGEAFVRFVTARYEPVDVVFRLAERFSTVLLPGGGFDAPPWSVRVSLANLPDETYEHIGDNLEAVMQGYFEEWQAARHT